jgi:transcriptional regulator with XRE-family HTH domain
MKTKQPNPVDSHVGRKIREARILNGLSQTALAQKVGITFQQLQKYESAANRVSCSRLYDLARVLGVPVQAFFAGAGAEPESADQSPVTPQQAGVTLDLATAYSKLDPNLRSQLSKTAKSIAKCVGKGE